MKKKLFFIFLVIVLFICVGIKAYQVTHSHARLALMHIRGHLQQLVGENGHYNYSKVKISWFTQSVVIYNLDMSLSNGVDIQVRKLHILPEGKNKVASLSGDDISIKSSNVSVDIASAVFSNLTLSFLDKHPKKSALVLNDLLDITYDQVFMHGVYFKTIWGKMRLGRLTLSVNHSVKNRSYIINNIDIAPSFWKGRKGYFDAFHFDQLIWEMSNDKQLNDFSKIASFVANTEFSVRGNGVVGFHKHRERVYLDQFNAHLSHKGLMWNGEVSGQKTDYDLEPSSSLFAEYLKRIGYPHLKGSFQSNFTYYSDSSLFTLHHFDYVGDDFLGMHLQGRFYIDRALFTLGLVDWTDNVLLKSVNLSLYNTGLKQHLFAMISNQTKQSMQQVEQNTLTKFNQFATGKDFELDHQFYKALADIIQHPNQMMCLSITFAQEERISSLLTMNFIDFFKLINQNNIEITTQTRQKIPH